MPNTTEMVHRTSERVPDNACKDLPTKDFPGGERPPCLLSLPISDKNQIRKCFVQACQHMGQAYTDNWVEAAQKAFRKETVEIPQDIIGRIQLGMAAEEYEQAFRDVYDFITSTQDAEQKGNKTNTTKTPKYKGELTKENAEQDTEDRELGRVAGIKRLTTRPIPADNYEKGISTVKPRIRTQGTT